jgi:hypothetical protein
MSTPGTPLTPEEKRQTVVVNIKSVLFYALSMTVALAFNDMIKSVFDSFPFTQHIVAKMTYVIIVFGLTILAAYTLGGKLST